ncbi:hypothetical protein TNIN_139251 [Trichonephila inaurata madagascariensis]|uniref:Uncharacterized protein n=1 Tax=Trichonephila inaurata madagascariensis TaxID=2747483 RepID=A0A8X7BWD8_9ARAC|nr:hypothetical protein TNIN_139251 [Trichonephila inaurata madagascariensis]
MQFFNESFRASMIEQSSLQKVKETSDILNTRRKHVTENRNQEDAEPTFLVIIMIRSQSHAKNSFMEDVEAMEIDMQLKKNAWIVAKSHKNKCVKRDKFNYNKIE